MYFTPERNERLARKLFRHIAETTTDRLDDIFEYELSIYSCPEIAKRECTQIFEQVPMMAAHASQIATPGSFITVQLNRSSVIVTRRADGSVGAYLNVCRHRGSRLVSVAGGQRNRFTCPYHGWTYGNDGKLRGIGFADSFGMKPNDDRNLVALPVEERHGFIWIVENPAGTIDVKAHLGAGMDQALGEYGLDKWFFYKDHVFDFPQNWKVMMDGLIDGYHVQFLHGATISPYFYPNMMGIEVFGNNALWGNPRRKMQELADQPPEQAPPLDRYAIIGNLFVPNAVMVMHPHHIEFWTIYQNPDNVAACRVHLRYLTPKAEHDARGVEILDKNWKIATDAIINEDVPVGNGIQASARMPHTGTVCLGRNEVTNQLFHRAYRAYMDAPR
ncbi:aromatic ring-hydroxylating oxygenase subunit alpha [Solimonas terrae]|uniref:Aromatic ring-hydroxylating dioxygenase subunit alpha n=1 Tax=Solimonas terrae TaxID=1396819 RepID=A0A6M2BNX3_9GAMM|nr:aromatic ring-hydroxylating dioxygenase subunit alpha [Solimonas terrae]NGY04332.1 aromatic ring-hydroxylating dioxygenase subunit alpha [Solimonas terrae]